MKQKKLTLICPNKSLFSINTINFLKKKFKCKIDDLSQSEFDKLAHKFQIVLTRFNINLKYSKKSNIRYILTPTTGLNHIDKKILSSTRVKVFNLIDKSFLKKVNATIEHTIFLILNILKKRSNKIKFGYKSNYKEYIVEELNNKTVGIIGFGRIGSKVGSICKAFGAKVIFYDKFLINKSNQKFEYVIKKSDIISFHVPLNKLTYRYYNYRKLKHIKKNAIIINTSRGKIFNENDLISLGKEKDLRFGLDVLANENGIRGKNSKLLNFLQKNSRNIVTPHVGGLTKESIEITDNHVISNFLKYLNEHE